MSKSIFTKKFLIYIGIGILSIILVGGLIYFIIRPKQTGFVDLSTIDKGLSPIRIIQVKNGKEQELNFTQAGAEILASSLMSDGNLADEIQKNVQNLGVDRIELPPLPEQNINIIPVDKLNSNSIDNYLSNLYNIFRDNSIQPNINQLSESALNRKTQDIQSLLSKNTDLYLNLFIIEVPPDAIKLHKAYIRIAQVQNSFLLGLLNASSDPLKLDINNKITINLLQNLDVVIKQELQILRQKYNLIYQR
jgi:hypothetical protein